ncbi:hypothetical protein BU17DRAFT_69580 [Hysterangium stoloniferum]|nr:hypothetical protein BU17DRAFT_69580 [Hysterangium stoloniferum]
MPQKHSENIDIVYYVMGGLEWIERRLSEMYDMDGGGGDRIKEKDRGVERVVRLFSGQKAVSGVSWEHVLFKVQTLSEESDALRTMRRYVIYPVGTGATAPHSRKAALAQIISCGGILAFVFIFLLLGPASCFRIFVVCHQSSVNRSMEERLGHGLQTKTIMPQVGPMHPPSAKGNQCQSGWGHITAMLERELALSNRAPEAPPRVRVPVKDPRVFSLAHACSTGVDDIYLATTTQHRTQINLETYHPSLDQHFKIPATCAKTGGVGCWVICFPFGPPIWYESQRKPGALERESMMLDGSAKDDGPGVPVATRGETDMRSVLLHNLEIEHAVGRNSGEGCMPTVRCSWYHRMWMMEILIPATLPAKEHPQLHAGPHFHNTIHVPGLGISVSPIPLHRFEKQSCMLVVGNVSRPILVRPRDLDGLPFVGDFRQAVAGETAFFTLAVRELSDKQVLHETSESNINLFMHSSGAYSRPDAGAFGNLLGPFLQALIEIRGGWARSGFGSGFALIKQRCCLVATWTDLPLSHFDYWLRSATRNCVGQTGIPRISMDVVEETMRMASGKFLPSSKRHIAGCGCAVFMSARCNSFKNATIHCTHCVRFKEAPLSDDRSQVGAVILEHSTTLDIFAKTQLYRTSTRLWLPLPLRNSLGIVQLPVKLHFTEAAVLNLASSFPFADVLNGLPSCLGHSPDFPDALLVIRVVNCLGMRCHPYRQYV